MYSRINELLHKGFSERKTAKILGVNRGTVKKYKEMSLDQYRDKAATIRKLSNMEEYKPIMLDWLREFPDMNAAQIYDWLKEQYQIVISGRSVSRYVKNLRTEYNIPRGNPPRDYEAVDELPMGFQMQLDFGVLNMPLPNRKGNKKVYFATFVLAHSRYKYGYFQNSPFTSQDLIRAMDLCFEYFSGTTQEIVIDQDSILVVSENHGDIIYTYEFEQYKRAQKLTMRVCRKADPESKGKIENVVKYFKSNFLAHRLYMEPDELNAACLAWLKRTGNVTVHGTTKKVPAQVFEFEREHLRPVLNTKDNFCDPSITRTVRKDNTILYNSNRYALPPGTYNKHSTVSVVVTETTLRVCTETQDRLIYEHVICLEKGKLIKPTDLRRDRDISLDALEKRVMDSLKGKLSDQWGLYLKEVRKSKSRYYRDQLSLLKSLREEYDLDILDKAMLYCLSNELYSVNDLKNTIVYMIDMTPAVEGTLFEPPLRPVTNKAVFDVITQKRGIQAYALVGGDSRE